MLETVAVSKAQAWQRAGRAGREAPGKVLFRRRLCVCVCFVCLCVCVRAHLLVCPRS